MGDTLGLTLVRALQTSADRHNDASATFAEGFMSEGGKLGRGCRVVWVKGLNPFASRHLTFPHHGVLVRAGAGLEEISDRRGKKDLVDDAVCKSHDRNCCCR